MELSWFESLLYGLISGVTEFIPVSSQAHQALMLKMFGTSGAGNLLTLLVRLAVLMALYAECRHHIESLRREQRLAAIPKRRRKRQPDPGKVMELRLLKTALVPILLGFIFYFQAVKLHSDLLMVCIFLIVNGAALFLPQMVRNANKDARRMTTLDGILFGICGACCMLPGLSRVGVISSVAVARGVDKEHALNWSLLLSIPALVCLACFDVFAIIIGGLGPFGILPAIGCVLAVAAAYLGARFAIRSLRTLSRRIGISGYGYYCWGAALFSFIMYLSI
jgi:undecaprenyl-diphosphatase